MEINYDTIMKYLTPDNEQDIGENTLNLPVNRLCKKNIISDLNFLNVDLTSVLKSTGNFYRLGVTTNIEEKNKLINVSFFTSVLTILDNKFLTLDDTESNTYVKKFIEQIKESISKTSFKFELKFKFPKNVLMDRVMGHDFNDGLIYQTLVQILDINILIFELDDEKMKIHSSFSGNSLNPWKPIIMLHKNKNYFEPIINENQKQFSINDNFMKILLEKFYKDVLYFNGKYLDKDFSIIDDSSEIVKDIINQYSKEEDRIEESFDKNNEEDILQDIKVTNCLESTGLIKKSSEMSEEESETDDEQIDNNVIKLYNKTALRSMKKDEIMSLISKNKSIFVHFSKPQKLTKNELIEKFIFFQNINNNQNSVKITSLH
jgi:hypothetical protein